MCMWYLNLQDNCSVWSDKGEGQIVYYASNALRKEDFLNFQLVIQIEKRLSY